MRVLTAFGLNDLRNIRRDSLLLYIVLIPWLLVVLVRLIVPGVTDWLAESFNFDLVPYYPLILSFFFVLQLPMLFGIVSGFLVLDERDEGTLTALRVTPISITSYALYRICFTILLSVSYVLACLLATGLMPISLLPSVVPVALVAGLLSPVFVMLLAAFANNKVEGLALMKGFGILLLGPLAAYFIHSKWQLLLGLLPSYWPAKAFWVASSGGVIWPYLLVGFIYPILLLIALLHRFRNRLYRY